MEFIEIVQTRELRFKGKARRAETSASLRKQVHNRNCESGGKLQLNSLFRRLEENLKIKLHKKNAVDKNINNI
jgi:hypothetical protein